MADNFETFYKGGLNHYQSGQWESAIFDFKKALKIDSDKSQERNVYFYLGSALKKMGKDYFRESVKYFNKSVKIWPNEPEHFFHLGHIYWQRFLPELIHSIPCKHESHYSNCYVYTPDAAKILNFYCTQNRNDSLKKSVNYYKKAVELDQKNPLYHHNLGIALYYYESPKLISSIRELGEAQDLTLSSIKEAKVLTLSSEFNFDGLNTITDPELKKHLSLYLSSTREMALIVLKELQITDQRSVYLKSFFKNIYRFDSNNSEAVLNLCRALEENGDFKEAIEYLKDGIQKIPLLDEYHYLLAICLMRHGSIDEAIDEFQNTLNLNTNFVGESYDWLIDIHTKFGNIRQAIDLSIKRIEFLGYDNIDNEHDDYNEIEHYAEYRHYLLLVTLKKHFETMDEKMPSISINENDELLFFQCRKIEMNIRVFIRCVMGQDDNKWWKELNDIEFKQRIERQINSSLAFELILRPTKEMRILDWFSMGDYWRVISKFWPNFSTFIKLKSPDSNTDVLRKKMQGEIEDIQWFRNAYVHLHPISEARRLKTKGAILNLECFFNSIK